MMVIDNKFEIGDVVYLKTDRDQYERIITGIKILPIGIIYRVSLGVGENDHYEIELTAEKNVLITTTN